MNRSYKSIWNTSLGAWVAASESVSGKGKASSNGRALRATSTLWAVGAAVALVAAMASPAHAQYAAGGGSATGASTIAIGTGAVATQSSAVAIGDGATVNMPVTVVPVTNTGVGGIAIGQGATTNGGSAIYPNVAIGYGAISGGAAGASVSATAVGGLAVASGTDSTALGRSAIASNNQATALGMASTASGVASTAVGRGANATQNRGTALGYGTQSTGNRSTALGSDSAATGDYSTALGVGAGASGLLAFAQGFQSSASGDFSNAQGYLSKATATNAIAIGIQTLTSVTNGVALGANSVSDRAIAGTTGTIPAGSSLINYNTTDKTLLGAVSVGNATSYRQITNVADGTQAQDAVTIRQLSGALQSFAVTPTKYFHANSAATDSLAIGAESVAIGPQTVVNGNNGIGMGNGATVQASAPGGIAIGQAATSVSADSIALGTQASALGVQGVAIGAGSVVNTAGGVALGAGSVASTVAGAAGYVPTGASTGQTAAVNATTSTLAGVSVGDAANGQFRQINGVAAGSVDSDAVNVSQLKAVQTAVVNVDASAVKYSTNADGSVNYNSVALGNGNATGPVTVSNVAPGVAGTDAVNVNQLNSGIASANAYTNVRVNQLQDQVRDVGKGASAGTASAFAMANLPQAYIPGKSMVSVGVGGFDGEAGMAIGVSTLSDNGRWVLKLSGSANSQGKVGIGAGAGFHW